MQSPVCYIPDVDSTIGPPRTLSILTWLEISKEYDKNVSLCCLSILSLSQRQCFVCKTTCFIEQVCEQDQNSVHGCGLKRHEFFSQILKLNTCCNNALPFGMVYKTHCQLFSETVCLQSSQLSTLRSVDSEENLVLVCWRTCSWFGAQFLVMLAARLFG